jgi:hypothetical protein
MKISDKPSPDTGYIGNWTEIPKFVVAGVPISGLAGLRTTVWLDCFDMRSGSLRPTTRWDFATRSVDCETMKHLMDEAKARFGDDGYQWRIRVRAGTRRIFE